MTRTFRSIVLLAFGLILAGCTGGSDVAQPATPEVVVTETPAVVVEPEETPTPEPDLVSEEERIAAAVAAFEANPQPENLIAYDYLEPQVSTNQVRLIICGWTGETVFDDVYQVAYRVANTTNNEGDIDVAFESANTTLDTCTNTTLIESALQATRDYDNYWRGVIEDPTSFDEEEAAEILTSELILFGEPTVSDWQANGLSYENSYLDGELPGSEVTELLARSYIEEDLGVFELIACRTMPADFGLYQGNVLIDDFREGSSNGPHVSTQYLFTRRDGTWKVLAIFERAWVDCDSFSDGWFAGINRILPDPVSWELVQ